MKERRPASDDPLTTPELQQLLATVTEGVVIADATRNIVTVNRAAEELWGYSARKLAGRPLHLLLSPEAREGEADWADGSSDTEAPRRVVLEAFHRDGSSFPVEASISRSSSVGNRTFHVVSVRDLSSLRASRERLSELETALASLPVGVTVSDLEGHLTFANPAASKMFGTSVEELAGRSVAALLGTDLADTLTLENLKREGSQRHEGVARHESGRSFPVEVEPEIVLDPDGYPSAIVIILQDISERRRAEAALRESEERYALALRGANDGLWDWDLTRDEIYFSDRWKGMLGLSDAEVAPDPDEWLSRVHSEDRSRLEEAIADHLDGRARYFETEYRVHHADGTYRWMLSRGMAVVDENGVPTRMAGSQTDITDRKVTDPLTGLPNRALFADRLRGALDRAQRHGKGMAVLLLDLDRFQVVNDSLGHRAGDLLLVEVAERLRPALARGDTLARLSADEFAILVEESDRGGAVALAEEFQRRLAKPFELAGQEIFATASIGITLGPAGTEHPDELLRDADTAMNRAKRLGRSRFQLFDEGMRHDAVAQLRIESDLNRALDRGELIVHYQPIVSLADDVINGFEALVRWEHPELGQLQPTDFIPLAEDTGLIVPIGLWVLEQATRQIRQWQDQFDVQPPLTVSVNLSPKQFTQQDLVARVRETLAATGLEPRFLKLEITEGAVVENPDQAVEVLASMRELGVQICIDDFGTGYSSLSYLHRYPIDTLKIDRSFVSSMGLEAKKADLVRTIVRMARDLGVSVIAEGVETVEQLRNLRSLPCEYMQGFCFSKPVDPEAAEALLASRRGTTSRFTEMLTAGWV